MTQRVRCPVHDQGATVEFLVGEDDGECRFDVAGCSLIARGGPVACGKVCRSTSVAPFGEWPGAGAGDASEPGVGRAVPRGQ